MYGRIPYLNNDWSSWAIHRFFLRHLPYYTTVWLGASPSVPLIHSGVMCEGSPYSIQWQDERSWRRMVHQNIYTRKETYRRFSYWIYGLSKQGTDRQLACNIFAEKERKQGNYQSYNSIFTNSSSQEPRTVEGSNHSSRTRIWVDQYSLWLQDRFRNNLWRNGQTNRNRTITE